MAKLVLGFRTVDDVRKPADVMKISKFSETTPGLLSTF